MIHHIRAAGVSLVVDARGTNVPVIVHWGAPIGEPDDDGLRAIADAAVPAIPPSSIDIPLRLSLLPSLHEGWSGRPAFGGFRADAAGTATSASSGARSGFGPLLLESAERRGERSLVVRTRATSATDAAASVTIISEIELSIEGVLQLRHTIENSAGAPIELGSLDAVLPVPDRASEILDFSGLWTHERTPQRQSIGHGVWSRESRHGRRGHDDAFLLIAGTPGFGFRSGETWAVHAAWSGDTRVWAERSALGPAVLGAGELLAPGELRLASGESYTSPWTIAVYSAVGIDGVSAALHPWIRSWSTISRPRPVVLNTWEAVYFDHALEPLEQLVDAAAEVGVERFVLDDGWFTGRTDDRRALGDWFVDAAKWPDGLGPLIDRVRAVGMEFGLWFEPEMVSRDSELARTHPEWVLGEPNAMSWRFQHVLDLGNDAAFEHIFGRIDALLSEYPISYIKWDHNRDLLTESAHRQTQALYRLIDAVREAHPGVEIESCASGGARIDLGILRRVDRVWTSDTNDPLERQQIQRYTGILLPPEYLGGHLGAARSHTTWRSSDLSFRLATALFGSAGIEWNLSEASSEERTLIAGWIRHYTELRGLLHSGTVVHADCSDPALALHGVVARDAQSALFAHVALAAPRTAIPAPARFVGLDADTRYRVRPLDLGVEPRSIQDAAPAWIAEGGVVLSGRVLATVGLPMPLLAPEQALLIELTAVAAG